MSVLPTHTPYDGSSQPFAIGLKPLDPQQWIEVDGNLDAYLAEKERRYAEMPERVLLEEAGTREAQGELLALLSEYLPRRFPDTYSRDADRMLIPSLGRSVDLTATGVAPFKLASLLVQEDLVLMRKGSQGWRLAAASLCFPSSWSLAEKFGRPLADIHAPVPRYSRGTRNAELIERMFDKLQGQAVERMNWSLQADPELYQPLNDRQRDARAASRMSRFPGVDAAASAFIRVERQTLRKLPVSGDIVFTIRIHVDPMRKLAEHPERATIAASFARQLAELDADQLDYKGLTADRDRLVAALETIAGK